MGDGRRDATAGDIRRALSLYRLACLIEAIGLAAATCGPVVQASSGEDVKPAEPERGGISSDWGGSSAGGHFAEPETGRRTPGAR